MNKSEYQEYLASREWALLREAVRRRSGGYCERCRIANIDAVHHKTYQRVGHEQLDDLMAICEPCHGFLSGKRHYDPRVGIISRNYSGENSINPGNERTALSRQDPFERAPTARSAEPSYRHPGLDKTTDFTSLRKFIGDCYRCKLAPGRTNVVFGAGNPSAELMFIGEAQGADEDLQGEPFVGRAGQLLTDIIERGMGISRAEVYICTVIKCRPPENRNPEPDEMSTCEPFLFRQIDLVRPKEGERARLRSSSLAQIG
jgi:Uracil DNA glycosylase superfamily